jgi:hypothetical protein
MWEKALAPIQAVPKYLKDLKLLPSVFSYVMPSVFTGLGQVQSEIGIQQ